MRPDAIFITINGKEASKLIHHQSIAHYAIVIVVPVIAFIAHRTAVNGQTVGAGLHENAVVMIGAKTRPNEFNKIWQHARVVYQVQKLAAPAAYSLCAPEGAVDRVADASDAWSESGGDEVWIEQGTCASPPARVEPGRP